MRRHLGASYAATLKVGDKIKFVEERGRYTIQARGGRFLVCTKPFNPKRTVLYTIIDLIDGVRGAENLVFGAGAETQGQCEEMVGRLESGETQVSHRNRVHLLIEEEGDRPQSPYRKPSQSPQTK